MNEQLSEETLGYVEGLSPGQDCDPSINDMHQISLKLHNHDKFQAGFLVFPGGLKDGGDCFLWTRMCRGSYKYTAKGATWEGKYELLDGGRVVKLNIDTHQDFVIFEGKIRFMKNTNPQQEGPAIVYTRPAKESRVTKFHNSQRNQLEGLFNDYTKYEGPKENLPHHSIWAAGARDLFKLNASEEPVGSPETTGQ